MVMSTCVTALFQVPAQPVLWPLPDILSIAFVFVRASVSAEPVPVQSRIQARGILYIRFIGMGKIFDSSLDWISRLGTFQRMSLESGVSQAAERDATQSRKRIVLAQKAVNFCRVRFPCRVREEMQISLA